MSPLVTMSEEIADTESRPRFTADIEPHQAEQIKQALKRRGVSASWAFRKFVPDFLKLIDDRKPRRKPTRAA